MVKLQLNVPEDFYNEEIRNDYLITTQMKQVWAVELDLLNQLLEVCKKHNIKIFASGGTMLGAVRHKGFIPWDDDIDMMMFRADYEKLCLVAPQEFKSPYFFQTEQTEPGSLRGHAQLRNSDTTGILKSEFLWKFKFNQGIFIDIFPLDSVPDDDKKFEKTARKIKCLKKMALYYGMFTSRYTKQSPNPFWQLIKDFLHILCKPKDSKNPFYEKFEKLCVAGNSNQQTKMVSTLSLDATAKNHRKYRSDFEELVEMPFEFITIPVAKNYDHVLTQRYGNWEKMEKQQNCHGETFFDVNTSYKVYTDDE